MQVCVVPPGWETGNRQACSRLVPKRKSIKGAQTQRNKNATQKAIKKLKKKN